MLASIRSEAAFIFGAVSTAIFFTVGSIEAVNPATGETHLLGEEGVWTPEMDGLVP